MCGCSGRKNNIASNNRITRQNVVPVRGIQNRIQAQTVKPNSLTVAQRAMEKKRRLEILKKQGRA